MPVVGIIMGFHCCMCLHLRHKSCRPPAGWGLLMGCASALVMVLQMVGR